MAALPEKNSRDTLLAKESSKTKKAREKLRRRLQDMDTKITKEALNKKNLEIHRWISRYADRRIILKDKAISLFDENENAAEASLKVIRLLEQLRELSE